MRVRKLRSTLIFLVVLCLMAGACGEKSAVLYRPLGMPTDVAFVEGRPIWRGLAVGRATRDEVRAALGQPEMTWSSGDLEVWRYLPGGYEREMYDFTNYFRLFFRQGVLQLITIQIWGVCYDGLRAELGTSVQLANPDEFIEHRSRDSVAVFASRGITAVVSRSPLNLYVDQLQYYVPMTVNEYMRTWGQFHPEEMPWPSRVPERVDTLGFVPGQTRRSEVEAALGPPDFEWADPRGGTKVVYYHAPGRGPDDLHRFDFRSDVLIWMDVKVWQEDYTIESAIARLGEVGVVGRAQFYDVIPNIQYYFWPEQGIVLVAQMEETIRRIKVDAVLLPREVTPNGADLVMLQARFEAIPLDLDKCAKIARKLNEELPAVVPP